MPECHDSVVRATFWSRFRPSFFLPDAIKGCKSLSVVEASVNPLGKLPDGFTQLLSLTQLYLNDTFLEYLPANFGRLNKLKILGGSIDESPVANMTIVLP